MTVIYETHEYFLTAIAEFVKQGLQFTADGDTMTITFTGGY